MLEHYRELKSIPGYEYPSQVGDCEYDRTRISTLTPGIGMPTPTFVGSTPFRYRVDESWPAFVCPGDAGEAIGVACDSNDDVFLFLRGVKQPVRVYDRDGTCVAMWG